jgi:hypothetical protein
MRCYFNLYDKCIYYEEAKQIPTTEVCGLCIKVYRLKYGLKTKLIYEGFRTGLTL